jgi:6-phosphogluconate dehydrogenase
MDLEVPVPTIDMAVVMRDLSKYKEYRVQAARQYSSLPPAASPPPAGPAVVEQIRNAFYFAMLVTYAQGLDQLRVASLAYNYGLQLQEVAKIWRGGCIIRAACLEDIRRAYEKNTALPNLLLDAAIGETLRERQHDMRTVVKSAIDKGIPVPALVACLSYFDAYRSDTLPTNLIQAQRDYFGAHTYERIDQEGIFHTQWS